MKPTTLKELTDRGGYAIGFAPQASGYMADDLAYEFEKSPSLIVNQKIGVIVVKDTDRKKIL